MGREATFVDIDLPDMSGLDLALRLRQHHPKREVVFITGSGTFEDSDIYLKDSP